MNKTVSNCPPGGFPFFFGGDRPFLEVDIFATPQPQFYQLLRSDGAAFSLISFLLAPGSANYVFPEPQNDLQLTGYLDGAVVASAAVTSQGGAATYDALSGFSAIDRLELRSVFTQNARDEFESSGADVFVTLDNLTLDAAMYVPLPPSFAALGAALALMGLAASRRRA